jgi:hypothetical protein
MLFFGICNEDGARAVDAQFDVEEVVPLVNMVMKGVNNNQGSKKLQVVFVPMDEKEDAELVQEITEKVPDWLITDIADVDLSDKLTEQCCVEQLPYLCAFGKDGEPIESDFMEDFLNHVMEEPEKAIAKYPWMPPTLAAAVGPTAAGDFELQKLDGSIVMWAALEATTVGFLFIEQGDEEEKDAIVLHSLLEFYNAQRAAGITSFEVIFVPTTANLDDTTMIHDDNAAGFAGRPSRDDNLGTVRCRLRNRCALGRRRFGG